METVTMDCRVFGYSAEPGYPMVVGFSVDESNEDYLLIQFSDQDDQDKARGNTGYYLELSYSGGAYSCLEKVVLEPDSILFFPNRKGIGLFGTSLISINMRFGDEDRNTALSLIDEIFAGDPSVELISNIENGTSIP